MKKALFLDRDGVINQERGYVCKKKILSLLIRYLLRCKNYRKITCSLSLRTRAGSAEDIIRKRILHGLTTGCGNSLPCKKYTFPMYFLIHVIQHTAWANTGERVFRASQTQECFWMRKESISWICKTLFW